MGPYLLESNKEIGQWCIYNSWEHSLCAMSLSVSASSQAIKNGSFLCSRNWFKGNWSMSCAHYWTCSCHLNVLLFSTQELETTSAWFERCLIQFQECLCWIRARRLLSSCYWQEPISGKSSHPRAETDNDYIDEYFPYDPPSLQIPTIFYYWATQGKDVIEVICQKLEFVSHSWLWPLAILEFLCPDSIQELEMTW